MKQDLQSDSVIAEMMEQEESTDETGNTSGKVKELATQIDVMRSSSDAVLSGIVKLDECVDTTEKYVLVTLGWKPDLSKAAAKAKASAKNTKAINESKPSNTKNAALEKERANEEIPSSSQKAVDKQDSGKSGSGVRIVIVEVEGSGTNLRKATSDALRSAIAQIFGEKFAASIESSELTQTTEVSNSSGDTSGLAVETSATQTEMSSETKGLIHSYEYISKEKSDEGIAVYLRVKLPKFESGIDPSKSTIIVLHPKLSPTVSENSEGLDAFRSNLQDNIVDVINRSRKLAVLDRRFLGDQINELRLLASGNSPVSEMARIGNTVGADLMFITEISNYRKSSETRTVGNTIIERSIFNSEVSIKIIDVATTNIVFSKRIAFRNRKFKSPNPESIFAKKAGTKIGMVVANKVGGGLNQELSDHVDTTTKKSSKEAAKRAEKQFNKAKEDVSDDW